MGPNPYLSEKAREVHARGLLREAEQERLLQLLPRHRRSVSRRAAGKLGLMLLKLGSWLKQYEHSATVHADEHTV